MLVLALLGRLAMKDEDRWRLHRQNPALLGAAMKVIGDVEQQEAGCLLNNRSEFELV